MNAIENGQLCQTAEKALRHGTGSLADLPKLIMKIIAQKAWERREIRPGKFVELSSLSELITRKPLEGWGEDPKKIEAVIKDDAKALAAWREAMTAPAHRPEKSGSSDNVTTSSRGNTKAYTVSRLQREAPELFEQVAAGKMSANKAAIKAGIRKQATPDQKAINAVAKCDNVILVFQALIKRADEAMRGIMKEMLT